MKINSISYIQYLFHFFPFLANNELGQLVVPLPDNRFVLFYKYILGFQFELRIIAYSWKWIVGNHLTGLQNLPYNSLWVWNSSVHDPDHISNRAQHQFARWQKKSHWNPIVLIVFHTETIYVDPTLSTFNNRWKFDNFSDKSLRHCYCM